MMFAPFDRIEKRVLHTLRNGPLTAAEIDEAAKINATQRRRALESLFRQGKVEVVPGARPTAYRVSE